MRLLSSLVLVLFCLLAIAPLAWHGLSSLKSGAELTKIPPTLLPERPTMENYEVLFTRRPLAKYYAKTFVIAALSSVLCVATASLAAYGLAAAVNTLPKGDMFGGLPVNGTTTAWAFSALGIVAVASALWPVWRAASLTPVEALCYER